MKQNILKDIKVEADLSGIMGWYRQYDMAAYSKAMERAVKDFHDFIKDHRSMDGVSLEVIREYEDQCSHCDYTWEEDEDGVPVCCQEAIDEHEAAIKEKMNESI